MKPGVMVYGTHRRHKMDGEEGSTDGVLLQPSLLNQTLFKIHKSLVVLFLLSTHLKHWNHSENSRVPDTRIKGTWILIRPALSIKWMPHHT